ALISPPLPQRAAPPPAAPSANTPPPSSHTSATPRPVSATPPAPHSTPAARLAIAPSGNRASPVRTAPAKTPADHRLRGPGVVHYRRGGSISATARHSSAGASWAGARGAWPVDTPARPQSNRR